jgi:hypothetical protein
MLVLLNLLCLFICTYLFLEELALYILNMDPGSGNNLGENYNPGSNNPGGGSNPGGGNNSGGDRNVMSIKNILNDNVSNTSINYNTLSPAQMHNILVTKQQAVLAERTLSGARSAQVSLSDAGYYFTRNQHTNFDGARVDSDQQTLFYLYRDHRYLFARKTSDTNITKIIEYYRNIM